LDNLASEAQSLFGYTCQIRRDIHRHPELGFQEFRTAEIIARELAGLGMQVTTGVGRTGVIGLLEGRSTNGPVVLLRFDMDALPVHEETGLGFASETDGVMHACGHDGHVAAGLTVAKLLASRRNDFHGVVKFMFQPAEEGLGGAESMLADGILANPTPNYALAMHIWNGQPYGTIAITDGALMAASGVVHIKVIGKGGHGAMPDQTVDPIVAAAHLIMGLQTVTARNINPLDGAVISITQVHAGETHNVIPPQVELSGTIRAFSADVYETVVRRIQEMAQGTAGAYGCSVEVKVDYLTPAVINHPVVASVVRDAARQVMTGRILSGYQSTVSEDMAYVLEKIPGCYILVGGAFEDGETYGHHHPRFNFVEDAMRDGAVVLTASTLNLLKQRPVIE